MNADAVSTRPCIDRSFSKRLSRQFDQQNISPARRAGRANLPLRQRDGLGLVERAAAARAPHQFARCLLRLDAIEVETFFDRH